MKGDEGMSSKYISSAMGTLGSSSSTYVLSCKEMLSWIRSVNVVAFRLDLDRTDSFGIYVDFIPKYGGKATTNYIYTNNKSLPKHLERACKEFIRTV